MIRQQVRRYPGSLQGRNETERMPDDYRCADSNWLSNNCAILQRTYDALSGRHLPTNANAPRP